MMTPRRDVPAGLLRLAACFLLLAAVAVSERGRALGRDASEWRESGVAALAAAPDRPAPPRPPARPRDRRKAAALLVLASAAALPVFARSRSYRTLQLSLDVAVLGFWNGTFLSTASLVGWAAEGLPPDPGELCAALLMLAMAFLWPLAGRPSHYCLWACPFGAAQELAGRLFARRSRLPPALVRRLEAFRRGLWAALVLLSLCAGWSQWMEWELFAAFAWRTVPVLMLSAASVFVALSAFVHRPYCRFVCPTGTLLKLSESNQPDPDAP